MVRILIEVPDASRLQLLADALAEAADMRTRAAGVAARQVLDDPMIGDKRSDAAKLLTVVADAAWIRSVAEQLPTLVLTDAPPSPSAPTAGGLPLIEPQPAPAPGPAEQLRHPPFAAPPRGHQFDLPPDATEALRRLTVPPGARLAPGDPIVQTPDPPAAAAQAQAALEALAGGDGDVYAEG